jgi:hypothetical protein
MKKDDSSEDYEGGESDEEEDAKSKKQSRPSSAISNGKVNSNIALSLKN